MPPSIRRSDDRVNDRVGCRISLRSSLVLCPTLRPCGFAGCASLVLCRTLRPCSVASCVRRWGRLCHEIRSLRRLVRSIVGINDQPSFVTWLLGRLLIAVGRAAPLSVAWLPLAGFLLPSSPLPQVAEAVGAGMVMGGSGSSILFSLDVAVGLWPLLREGLRSSRLRPGALTRPCAS